MLETNIPNRRGGGGTYGIYKQNQDENKRNLHAILQLCNQGTLRDEPEHPLAPCEWEGEDQEHKDAHLREEEDEYLCCSTISVFLSFR